MGFSASVTLSAAPAAASAAAAGSAAGDDASAEEEGAAPYTSGSVSTTILFLVQLVVTGLCFLAEFKKAGKTIDYKKILEEW